MMSNVILKVIKETENYLLSLWQVYKGIILHFTQFPMSLMGPVFN